MSQVPDRRAVLRTALRVLDHGPDPAACLRLRREVLRQPADAAEVLAAWAALRSSRAYGELVSTQRRDGGWGRFHSEDARRRRPVPTTEYAVRRALALGVPSRACLLERARIHCEALLAGRQPFPDPPERNDRWPAGWRLFVGATLARIAPRARAVGPLWRVWCQVLAETFADGRYEASREQAAHRRLTGATVRDTYLTLDNPYTLELLGARTAAIPADLRRAYLHWLGGRPRGLRYLEVPLARPETLTKPGQIDRWLTSWELLSAFSDWADHARPALAWLWRQRTDEGLWDFGARPQRSHALPLSQDWRRAGQRRIDWSTRALVLLARRGGRAPAHAPAPVV